MSASGQARVLAELGRSPDYLLQKFEPIADRVLLLRLNEQAYRASSFLDDRIITQNAQGFWADYRDVAAALATADSHKPLHFIFHTGHVGSTLLSRLLSEIAPVLPVREPLPLRTLAEAHDVAGEPWSLFGREGLAERLGTFLRSWSRGYAATSAVVVKATSSAGRLAPKLLEARPEARAVYLNLAAEPYLATLLAGANAALDLRGHAPERLRRLHRQLGEAPLTLDSASIGELAAMSWLAETLAQRQAVATGRVLALDFDALLRDIPATMATVAAHFSLTVPAASLSSLASSPVLSRYSKASEHAYSPALRQQLLDQARREEAAELRKGLLWLEATEKRFGSFSPPPTTSG